MKIEKSYNGWPGKVRSVRGSKFYSQVRSGKIPKPTECCICGHTLEDGAGMTYHAEEYGPTWEDYVSQAKPLCAYCHMMMHLRFKYPNRFRRFRSRIREGWMPPVFSNIGEAMKAMLKHSDIPHFVDTYSGIPWLDSVDLKGWSGHLKIATIDTGNGVQVPDPACYPELQKKNDPDQYTIPFTIGD